jgi:glutamine phosphoribosylpyrophosphate amidotransferase
VVNDDGLFTDYRDVGLVNEVFTPSVLDGLPQGTMAVGHVRYGTTGGDGRENCQPIVVNHIKGRMALAHNGNLTNSMELRQELEMQGLHLPHHQRHGGHLLRHHQGAHLRALHRIRREPRPWTGSRARIRW